ncbi:MAG: histidine kinase dimerization/phospho-acceptor domain-containing protein, partial [Thermoanaerobaculia bacterium]|nr:histidine kinase dimerization/phospho-acceptor domain-containing protein [Thermoanaerobaculia bacterium]
METVVSLFDQSGFMPHGQCYLWKENLVWLHAVSDALIALAYFTIPLTLAYFVKKRRDLPFSGMFLAFGLFIVTCGGTHAFAVWNIWHSDYWLSGGVKALTAMASLTTAALLVPLVPKALALPSPRDLAREVERRHRAEAEAGARRLEEEYTKKVEKANRELERVNQELEEFVLVASHDLQAPLRKVESFGEILEEEAGEDLGEAGRDALHRMTGATRRMARLLDDLLRLSRVSTRGEPLRPVDLSRILA